MYIDRRYNYTLYLIKNSSETFSDGLNQGIALQVN